MPARGYLPVWFRTVLSLVCIDVDGTLVGSTGAPTPEVWAAAGAAVARGQHLAIATARPPFAHTWGYAERLDPAGWHIFHNGAALVRTGSREARPTALTAAQVAACVAEADASDWVLEHYDVFEMAVDSDAPLAVDHAGLLGVTHQRRSPAGLAGPMVRVQFVVPIEMAADAVAAAPVGTEAHAATSPIMEGAAFVSVTSEGVSKAAAIVELASMLGIDTADVMMVGDAANDIAAMGVVGHPVAMGNADELTAAAARYRVAHVDDDGVVEALALSAEL
jgi:Cof subfamily protein (haloacid dehalogenase superfamily)